MTLFLAFLDYFIGEGSFNSFFSTDFIKTEFFFRIDFPPPALGCLGSFLTSFVSSPSPKFYLTSLLITIWLLPKILCWLPSSESESFLMFYFNASLFSIDFLLLFKTTPSMLFLDIISNLDLLGWFPPVTFTSYLGT